MDWMRENTGQNNSEHGHFLSSEKQNKINEFKAKNDTKVVQEYDYSQYDYRMTKKLVKKKYYIIPSTKSVLGIDNKPLYCFD